MNREELRQLRAVHKTLTGQAVLLDRIKDAVVLESTVRPIEEEIAEISGKFPGLLPPFKREAFFAHDVGRGAYYRRDGLAMELQRAIGKLEAAISVDEGAPVTEVRDFLYVTDVGLRDVIRDGYQEVQRAFIAQCWKATVILSGSLIEALLLFVVSSNSSAAQSAKAAPNQADISKWGLSDLINVAVELSLVGVGVEKLSHSVREYRNLVHPGNALRNGLTSGPEEARIALEVLRLLDRELSP